MSRRRAACGSPIRSPDRRNRCARRRRHAVADTGGRSGSRPTGRTSGCAAIAAAGTRRCRFRSTATHRKDAFPGSRRWAPATITTAAETGSQMLTPRTPAEFLRQFPENAQRGHGRRRASASCAQQAATLEATTGAAAIAKNGTWRAERSARNPQTNTSSASKRSASRCQRARCQVAAGRIRSCLRSVSGETEIPVRGPQSRPNSDSARCAGANASRTDSAGSRGSTGQRGCHTGARPANRVHSAQRSSSSPSVASQATKPACRFVQSAVIGTSSHRSGPRRTRSSARIHSASV